MAFSKQPLAHLLDTEISQYETFLAVLEEERDALRTLSYSGLLDINRRKSECLAQIRDAEQERISLTSTLTGHSGPPSPETRSQYDRLNELAPVIREAMTFNRYVIERSLGRVEALLSLWSHAVVDNATYCPTGSHELIGGHGQFVSTQG